MFNKANLIAEVTPLHRLLPLLLMLRAWPLHLIGKKAAAGLHAQDLHDVTIVIPEKADSVAV